MAYGNRGGGYGRQGGGYQNNRNSGGGYRGGNRGSYGGGSNRGAGGGDNKYLRSSSFTKTLILDAEGGRKERIGLEPGVTEEIAVTLTADKAQDIVKRIQTAIASPDGDGGIRITLYCQHKVNQDTNEEFDGASLLIVGKFPPKEGGQQRGNFQRGGGRRDYPNDARGGTQQSGQNYRGNQTQGSQQGGRTQNAQNDASHSDEKYANDTQDQNYKEDGNDNNYTEQSGW